MRCNVLAVCAMSAGAAGAAALAAASAAALPLLVAGATARPLPDAAGRGDGALGGEDAVCLLKTSGRNSSARGAVRSGILRHGRGKWRRVAPVPSKSESKSQTRSQPEGVVGPSVAVVGARIVVALGSPDDDAIYVRTTRIYNPYSNRWSFGRNAPVAASRGVGLSRRGIFYHLGGRNADGTLHHLLSYDIAKNTWASLEPMEVARLDPAAVVLGDAIYAVGGFNPQAKFLAEVERYDIKKHMWTRVESLPGARSSAAAATFGGVIYLFGGFISDNTLSTTLNTVLVYKPSLDRWFEDLAPDMPTARGFVAYAPTIGGRAYLVSGAGEDGDFGDELGEVEAYRAAAKTWETDFKFLPTRRSYAGVAAFGGKIYVFGGLDGQDQGVKVSEVFKPWCPRSEQIED